MSLVPEDNTGLVNADTYLDVPAFKLYCTARGVDYTALALNGDTGDSDTVLENLLRIGFQFVNANWRYKSIPKNNDQAGEFPRVDLADGMGRVFNTVPQRVKDAQCEATILKGQGNELFIVAARGGMITREAIGPISTDYAPAAPAETLFQSVQALLLPFIRDASSPRTPLPSYNDYSDTGSTDPIFSIGMDDDIQSG